MPNRNRDKPVLSVLMTYSYYTNTLGIIENEVGGGYRILFWEIKNNCINLLFLNELEHANHCIELLFFESMNANLQFAIAESNCIKYWQFVDGKAL